MRYFKLIPKWIFWLLPLLLLWVVAQPGSRALVFSGGTTVDTKGWRLCQDLGCFNCHQWEGRGGIPNPGAQTIPGFQDFNFLMSIYSEKDLEQWILLGKPSRLDAQTDSGRAIVMPAYQERITRKELQAIKRYYQGVSGMRHPVDPAAKRGFQLAQASGCFSCHGVGGRLDMPNPGSLVGRIPAWNGPDFKELVRDEQELRAWIMDGSISRLKDNAMAQFFLRRQLLEMPRYRDFLKPEELADLVAYIQWLNHPELPGHIPKYGTAEDRFFDY